MIKKSTALVVFLCLTITLVSCATKTSVREVWQDPSFTGHKLQSVLVVGIASSPENEKAFETDMARHLSSKGVKAVALSSVNQQSGALSKQVVKDAAIKAGTPHVLVTHVAGVEKGAVSSPPMTNTGMVGRDHFGVYYTQAEAFANQAGSYSQYTLVKLETRIFDTQSEKPVWTANTETLDPKSVYDTISTLCTSVIDAMAKDGLL